MSKRSQETYKERRKREIRFFLRNGYRSEDSPQPNPPIPPIIDFVDLEEEMEVDELVNAPIQPVASSSGSVTHVLDGNSGATEVGILQQGIRQSQSQTDNHSQSTSQILTATATVSSTSVPVLSLNDSLMKIKDKLTNVIETENRNATALVPVNDPEYLIRQLEEKLGGLLIIDSELKSCIVSTREGLNDLKERALVLNKPGTSVAASYGYDDSESD